MTIMVIDESPIRDSRAYLRPLILKSILFLSLSESQKKNQTKFEPLRLQWWSVSSFLQPPVISEFSSWLPSFKISGDPPGRVGTSLRALILFILVTHPRTGDLRESLKYICNLYVECVVKIPLYSPGSPIRDKLFNTSLDQYSGTHSIGLQGLRIDHLICEA
ncbi:hypothetical protein F8388_020700 [Cannabis sativa]|uniref:Trafficking protein particle complex subunit n=1 Tax=Cannabis sativa TaxID=3483 RepID=A0A7J6G537_CANSA|nr:hypothetical protein F8388_020700 [Cannabis sativa]